MIKAAEEAALKGLVRESLNCAHRDGVLSALGTAFALAPGNQEPLAILKHQHVLQGGRVDAESNNT